MPICSNRLGSQGESSKETTGIATCCCIRSCHRFQDFQDFLCGKKRYEKQLIVEKLWRQRRQRRTLCFLKFAHLGLFLGNLGFACRNYVENPSCLPCLSQTVDLWHAKDIFGNHCEKDRVVVYIYIIHICVSLVMSLDSVCFVIGR